MKSKATAVWTGSLKEGNGKISAGSGALNDLSYTFATRFESARGTNPEELIAASHAGCFSMALSAELGKLSVTPEKVETTATVVLEKDDTGFSVTESQLVTMVKAGKENEEKVRQAAAAAKEGCPISKLLKARISLDLSVE